MERRTVSFDHRGRRRIEFYRCCVIDDEAMDEETRRIWELQWLRRPIISGRNQYSNSRHIPPTLELWKNELNNRILSTTSKSLKWFWYPFMDSTTSNYLWNIRHRHFLECQPTSIKKLFTSFSCLSDRFIYHELWSKTSIMTLMMRRKKESRFAEKRKYFHSSAAIGKRTGQTFPGNKVVLIEEEKEAAGPIVAGGHNTAVRMIVYSVSQKRNVR